MTEPDQADTDVAKAATSEVFRRHLNQEQLARRWSLSPRTLERWRSTGQGPSYLRLGGRVVYPLEAIQAFEEQSHRPLAGSRHEASR